MNYSQLFYWVSVADNARIFFGWFAGIFTAIAIIATIVFIVNKMENDDKKLTNSATKWMFWSYPFMVLFWAGIVLCPTKKQSLLIIAGGQTLNYLTTNETAKQIPQEIMTYVVSELRNMAKDANVELGIKTEKEKILEDVKNLSSEELLELMKKDPNLAKIVLGKD